MAQRQLSADEQSLGSRICEASVTPAHWVGVIRAIEDQFPGATCEIISEPHPGEPVSSLPYKITRNGLRSDIPNAFRPGDPERGVTASRPGDLVPIGGGAWRSGPGLFPPPAGPNGSALLLHRSTTRDWFLALRYVGAASILETKSISSFLFRNARHLMQAFRIGHDIATGTLPARSDLEAVWDRLPCGIVLLSSRLTPLVANVAAEEAFSARRLFSPSGPRGRVRLRERQADEELDGAVLRITEMESDRATVTVGGAHGDADLLIELAAAGRCGITRAMRPEDHALPDHLLMILRALPDAETNVTRLADRTRVLTAPAA